MSKQKAQSFILQAVDDIAFNDLVDTIDDYYASDPGARTFTFRNFNRFKEAYLFNSDCVTIPKENGMVTEVLQGKAFEELKNSRLPFVYRGHNCFIFSSQQNVAKVVKVTEEVELPSHNKHVISYEDNVTEQQFLLLKHFFWGHEERDDRTQLFADQLPVPFNDAFNIYEKYETMGIAQRFTQLGWSREIMAGW